ncbi:unnamed protein product [Caenorhabditis angaria]|uniref:Uncharacterized protein n=1 Tax=Caenorhabditis angaria TaxID=860376 RepID=A0A9P1J564_9PELO|nr:unnamed protein product [Caenorhabditis angaria]
MVQKVVSRLLKSTKPLIFGMIHVPALPGTPSNVLPISKILKKVQEEAQIYSKSGVDGIIIENMHDVPYSKPPAGPEIVSAMTLACQEVRSIAGAEILLGVQILAAANREALAVASITGMDFIRAEGFVYSHVADEGWIDACAADLLRYRKYLGAENVAVFTDIKKKHSSHSVTSDLSICEIAQDAKFNLANGVIVTGSATGHAANPEELKQVATISDFPVLIGSGVNAKNLKSYKSAHGLIIGSEFKKDGKWQNDLDPARIRQIVKLNSK